MTVKRKHPPRGAGLRGILLLAAVLVGTAVMMPVGTPSAGALSPLKRIEALPLVEAQGTTLTLLDLMVRDDIPEDWREIMESLTVGDVPALGTEKFIQPENLRLYLERFFEAHGQDPSRTQIILPERIVVRRKTRLLELKEIEDIYREFVRGNAPWNPEDIVIDRIRVSGLTMVPCGRLTHRVEASPEERYLGNVALTMQFSVDGEEARNLRVAGFVQVEQDVVRTTRPLNRDEAIGMDDVRVERLALTSEPGRYLSGVEQAVGKRVIRNIGSGEILDPTFLAKPLLITRGEPVTIVYQKPGLRLTARGQAREDGAAGDLVRVINLSSSKLLSCRVLDSGTVLVSP
jgi:flagella basal body P-ring formation protein FlgA